MAPHFWKNMLGWHFKKKDLSFPTLKQLSSYMHTTKASRGIVYYGNFRENIGLLWSE